MDTSQQNNLFAPPAENELSGDSGMFAPPKQEELFAPPKPEELQTATTARPESEKTPDMLRDEDFQKIGQKYGVDPEDLRSLAPYYGATAAPRSLGEAVSQGAKAVAGSAGRSALFGVPQFAYKKLQDEKTRNALDELREIGQKQTGAGQEIGEAVTTPVTLLGKGASALGRIGETAGIAGALGLTGSKEGEEISNTATGVGLGLAGGAGGELLGKKSLVAKTAGGTALGATAGYIFGGDDKEEGVKKGAAIGAGAGFIGGWLFNRASRLAPTEAGIIEKNRINVDKGASEIAQRNADSENLLKDIGVGSKTTLDHKEIDTLLEQQLGKDGLENYLNPSTPEGQAIRSKIGGPAPESVIKQQLAEDVIGNRFQDFAEYLTKERPKDAERAFQTIEEIASREGVEATVKRYDNFTNLNNAEKYIETTGLVAKDQPGFFGQSLNKMSDSQYVLRWLDEKYGIHSEDALREFNKANNRYTFVRQATRKELEDTFQLANKAGLDDEIVNGTKIYDALDSGNREGLTPKENAVADRFKQYFDDSRNFVNEVVSSKDPNISPLNIPKVENYVPKTAKSVDEIVPIVEGKIDNVLSDLSGKYDRNIGSLGELNKEEFAAAIKNGDLEELVNFAKWTQPNVKVESGADLNRAIADQLYTREGQIGIESRARAAMERTGQVPDFILEKNLYKLADKWSLNTTKHLYLRNPMDKLAVEAQKLDKLGAAPESQYIRNLLQDIKGVRQGTAAEGIMKARIQAGRKLDTLIDETTNPVKKLVLLTARSVPDLMYAATRQLYPNMLGWNLHSALMHTAVSFGRIAPELGGTYGYAAMMRGAMNAVSNLKRFHDLAQQLGTVPASFIRNGERALADGIARSGVFQKLAGANNALGKVGMTLFQAGESWNRALVLGTAEVMSKDIARGSNAAMASLRRFPRNVQEQILANPKDQQMVFQALGKYLNDTTMFNYNKASMFELGRTLGPVLSTFSKWPTAIAGEAIYELRSKGLMQGMARNLERLAVPYLMLTAAQYAMFGAPDEMSDRERKALGAKGLGGLAPIGALHEFTSGKQFTPPSIDIVYNGVIKPALEGHVSRAGFGLDNMLKSYAPQAGLLRGLTDDLVTFATGHRPEGKTFVERTVEGARDITK